MTTIDEHEGDCPHGVWPATSCTLCNGREKRERAAAAVIEYEFPARFESLLGCGHFSTIGETIARRVDGTLVCTDCANQRGN